MIKPLILSFLLLLAWVILNNNTPIQPKFSMKITWDSSAFKKCVYKFHPKHIHHLKKIINFGIL